MKENKEAQQKMQKIGFQINIKKVKTKKIMDYY